MSASLELGNGNWAVKSDALLGYKVINGKYYPRDFTVTRASTATRVNAQGLVELTPYNLASWSEQFDNVYWTKTASTITSNSVVSPSGSTDADTLTADGTSNRHDALLVLSATSGTTYTYSVYAKKNTNNFIQLSTGGGFGSNVWANFNLATGVVGSVGSLTTASIQSVGDGWYRCTMTGTATLTGTTGIYNLIVTSTTASRLEVNTLTTSIFIWGAQLVEGTQPLDYLPTTDRLDVARIDYSLGSANLLLEPQRTNLALQSSSFDSASWGGIAVITVNSHISPSGVMDADTLTDNNNTAYLVKNQNYSITANAAYTTSIFIRKTIGAVTNYPGLTLLFSGGSSRIIRLIFNTTTGTFNFEISGLPAVNSYSARVVNFNADYWRVELTTQDNQSNTSVAVIFSPAISSDGTTISSAATGSAVIWGAQLEAGAYATSYIPTTTASVTRVQDVVIKTGASSLIGQAQGTLFLEASSFNFLGNGAGERISLTDGTFNNRINIDLFSGGQVQMVVVNSTTGLSATITAVGTGITGGSKFKIAVAYDGANSRLYVNGTAYTTIVGTIPTFNGELSVVEFNQGNTARPFFGRVEKLTVYPERLTNAELISLTTL